MHVVQCDNDQVLRAAWGQELIPIPAPHTLFCPHYRRYRGNTTKLVPNRGNRGNQC